METFTSALTKFQSDWRAQTEGVQALLTNLFRVHEDLVFDHVPIQLDYRYPSVNFLRWERVRDFLFTLFRNPAMPVASVHRDLTDIVCYKWINPNQVRGVPL